MSGCKTSETTNQRLDKVEADIRELISWAEADREHALENDATETARDDRLRVKILQKALVLIRSAHR